MRKLSLMIGAVSLAAFSAAAWANGAGSAGGPPASVTMGLPAPLPGISTSVPGADNNKDNTNANGKPNFTDRDTGQGRAEDRMNQNGLNNNGAGITDTDSTTPSGG